MGYNKYRIIYFHREKTWKAQTKVKRQWQVNLPDHIDTIQHDKRIL